MPIEEIAPGVFIETEYRMANVGCIVTDEGVVLVDAPIAPTEARKWREFVLSKGEPRYFLCTHEHPDHIGGHGFFSEAETICHESIKDKFAGCQELLTNFLPAIGLEEDRDFTGYTARQPSFTFTERMTLIVGGRRIDFLSGDGHTPCHGMVWLPEESVFFAGDNVVNQWPPFCHDAVIDGWSATLNRIYSKIHPHLIVPGHGPICDGSFALNVRDILEEAKSHVRYLIAQGKTQEEVSEMAPFGDRFDIPKWFGPADRLRKATMENLYDFCQGT
jgi:cyclase